MNNYCKFEAPSLSFGQQAGVISVSISSMQARPLSTLNEPSPGHRMAAGMQDTTTSSGHRP